MLDISIEQLNIGEHKKLSQIKIPINPGTVTLLIGENGSGKSSIANAVMGLQEFKGHLLLDNQYLTSVPTYKRAQMGLFYSPQYQVPISGVTIASFLRNMYMQAQFIDKKLDLVTFKNKAREYAKLLGFTEDILNRELNVNFSGGECKKLEILQLMLLNPKYAILDEIDSGLDSKSQKLIYEILTRQVENGLGVLLISHNDNIQKLLGTSHTYELKDGAILRK